MLDWGLCVSYLLNAPSAVRMALPDARCRRTEAGTSGPLFTGLLAKCASSDGRTRSTLYRRVNNLTRINMILGYNRVWWWWFRVYEKAMVLENGCGAQGIGSCPQVAAGDLQATSTIYKNKHTKCYKLSKGQIKSQMRFEYFKLRNVPAKNPRNHHIQIVQAYVEDLQIANAPLIPLITTLWSRIYLSSYKHA